MAEEEPRLPFQRQFGGTIQGTRTQHLTVEEGLQEVFRMRDDAVIELKKLRKEAENEISDLKAIIANVASMEESRASSASKRESLIMPPSGIVQPSHGSP